MRDELLALLEDGGHTVTALAEWLGADRLTVIRALKALEQQGLVAKTEQGGTGVVWRLTGVPPAPALRSARPNPREQNCSRSAPPGPIEVARKPGRPKKVLRQPHERPPSQVLPKEVAPSWWVGLGDQFYDQARQERDRLTRSRTATKLREDTVV